MDSCNDDLALICLNEVVDMTVTPPRTGIAAFCGNHPDRIGYEYLLKPWKCEGKFRATNGHILVEMDDCDIESSDDPPPEKVAERIQQWLDEDFSHEREWIPLPELPEFTPCLDCEGTGKDEDEDCGICWTCDGYGERRNRIPAGGVGYCVRYLRLLSSLPNIEFSPNGLDRAPFRFTGGRGLLMPMKE